MLTLIELLLENKFEIRFKLIYIDSVINGFKLNQNKNFSLVSSLTKTILVGFSLNISKLIQLGFCFPLNQQIELCPPLGTLMQWKGREKKEEIQNAARSGRSREKKQ